MNIKYVFNIIGKIIFTEGLLLLLPLAVALIYGENTVWAYALSALLLLALGVSSFIKKPKNTAVYAREGMAVVGLGWIAVSLLGALPIWLTREIPSYLDCVFEVVSGFTTTGASILTEIEHLSMSNLFWRSFTHWIGGMGVLVFVLAVLPQTDTQSMHLMRAEVPGPTVGKFVAKIRLTARILYAIYMALTLAEVILLLFGGMPLFDSLVHSFATAGTGGFSIKNISVAAYDSAYIDGVITVFMLLFSLNFNLYYLILLGDIRQVFKSEELHWFAGIVGFSILAVSLNILPLYKTFGRAFRYAAFQVASIISTTGFATADFNLWPNFSRALLVLLMFFGACAGSTGGGIKIARLIVICRTAAAQIRKQIFPRSVVSVKLDGKIVEPEVRDGINSYMFAYLIIFSLSIIAVSLDGFDLITDFTAVAACLNNIGPGLEIVGAAGNYSGFNPFSKLILIFDMLAGRLELFPMIVLFSPYTWRKR